MRVMLNPDGPGVLVTVDGVNDHDLRKHVEDATWKSETLRKIAAKRVTDPRPSLESLLEDDR